MMVRSRKLHGNTTSALDLAQRETGFFPFNFFNDERFMGVD
ncbi:hypothetical protein [Lysobacter terrae]